MKRECLYQEDNGGLGSEIGEVYWHGQDGDIYESETAFGQFLNPETVDRLRASGVDSVFLLYRGRHHLEDVMREP